MRDAYGICWDLGDVIFSEETEVKSPEGVTQSVSLVPGIAELLLSLADRGIPMAIVSDTRVGACENVLGSHGLERCFRSVVVSEAFGFEKPDPRLFSAAADALGIPLRRLVMVGNHYYRDVEGAKQAGMTAIWFHWNERYPSPPGAPAANYTATDATELAAAIGAWLASLDRPYVAAHRGARRLAPENTLPAFSAALESGGSALELDVHLTRDERIVVIHDDLLERTTNGHGPISALTSAEIDSLDAGSWFGPAFSGTRVPYLEEVISLAQRFDARLHIELKGARAWLLADRVVEMVRKMGAVDSAVIMSFDLNAVLAAARSGPEIPTLAIVSGPLRKQLDFVLSTGLSGLNQSVSLWDEATIGTFHQHGLIAHGSLVNDREELDAFFAKGGDMADSDSMDCLAERAQWARS